METRNGHTVLVGKSQEKRPLGRYGHRQEDNIKKHLSETEVAVS